MPHDNNNQIIVSKVVSDNDRAPAMRAEITVNGQRYKAGLWLWTRKDGSPVLDRNNNKQLKGTVEVDDYQRDSQPQQPPQQGGGPSMDDDIPFSPDVPEVW